MDDCIFCKIIKGEIPSSKIYEDNDVLAILDISQITHGHALVMPKKHYDNFLTTPKEILHKVMDAAQRIGQAEMSVLGAVGVNILSNVGERAGQTVMHFHVHVIPRYNSDTGFRITFKGNDVDKSMLPILASKIREKL